MAGHTCIEYLERVKLKKYEETRNIAYRRGPFNRRGVNSEFSMAVGRLAVVAVAPPRTSARRTLSNPCNSCTMGDDQGGFKATLMKGIRALDSDCGMVARRQVAGGYRA